MPSPERLNEFIAAVESGDHVGAIERFYTVDASMQENGMAPREGRGVLVAHERKALSRMSRIESKCVSSAIEGDRVFINWIFDITDSAGKTRRMDEVSVQEWQGDLIKRERFYYDPAWMND